MAVLQVYLDDAGDKRHPVQTMAGFVAPEQDWVSFDKAAGELYSDPAYGIKVLHTSDFYHSRNEFDGWSWPKKRQFISKLFDLARESMGIWIDFTIDMANFRNAIKQAPKRRFPLKKSFPPSPLGFCFYSIVGRLHDDQVLANLQNFLDADLSFIVEKGHKNNPNVQSIFDEMQGWPSMRALRMRGIAFDAKEKSKALQLADFYAFYCRRLRARERSATRYADDYNFFVDATDSIHGISFHAWEFDFS